LKIKFEIDLSLAWARLSGLMRRFNIGHFLLLYFAAHMLQIGFPSDGSMIFDEAHYVPASLDTLMGIAANAEHPPLPKVIGALGIALFGNNWFGWRFPQVVIQVVALYLFYLIGKRLLGNPWAFGATAILAFDPVFFIHGGALLIDMPSFLFSFLAIELYMRRNYGWSAASMGLAFLSREMSIFYFGALAIYHFFTNRQALKPAFKLGLRYVLIALLIFGSLLWFYDLAYKPPMSTSVTDIVSQQVLVGSNGTAVTTVLSTSQSISQAVIWNPIQHLLFIYNYHGPNGIVLNASYEPYQYAWNWILPVDPFNVPTYFRVDVAVASGGVSQDYTPIWYISQGNLSLWYGFWPAMAGLIYAMARKKESATAVFIASGIILNFAPWVALSILVRRIGFNYYMIYTLPFIALGLAFTWRLLPEKYGKLALAVNVLLSLVFFLWFFPVKPFP
jgi:4-amino-4-deoxy-L-arabinose transferase-like glycosyltransferase